MENLIWSAPLERGELYILDGGLSTQLARYVKVPCETLNYSSFLLGELKEGLIMRRSNSPRSSRGTFQDG